MESDVGLSIADAARRLKVHPQTIRTWIRSGKMPASRVGRLWRIRASVVEAMLGERWDHIDDEEQER